MTPIDYFATFCTGLLVVMFTGALVYTFVERLLFLNNPLGKHENRDI